MCGEKPPRYSGICTVLGSPPRMRGKVQPLGERGSQAGITPAYAGKSRSVQGPAGNSGDHPRVCGEKSACRIMSARAAGSPPRVRGKGRCHHPVILVDGITPAYAGKSLSPSASGSSARDHPRVCGEKTIQPIQSPPQPGSPPRMRGKVLPYRRTVLAVGITPACAGKSS